MDQKTPTRLPEDFWRSHQAAMERLFASKPERSAGVSREMFNALHDRDLPGVQSLARSGFDPKARDEQGRTALLAALESPFPDLDIVRALAACGGLGEADHRGHTPLMRAALKNLAVGAEFIAAMTQDEIDARDAHGRTALMIAMGHTQFSSILRDLANASDANLRDSHGDSAAFLALKRDDSETAAKIIALLIDRVDIRQTDAAGWHLDERAASLGHARLAEELLARREEAELKSSLPLLPRRPKPPGL